MNSFKSFTVQPTLIKEATGLSATELDKPNGLTGEARLDILKKLDTAEEYIGPSGIGPGQFKEKTKLAELRIVDGVGCEKFAEMIYQELESFISKWKDDGTLLNETVKVTSVEVFEHAGNSAIYQA